jgi:hypothetical protein
VKELSELKKKKHAKKRSCHPETTFINILTYQPYKIL